MVIEGDLHAFFVNGLHVDVTISDVLDHTASPALRFQSDPYIGAVHGDILKDDVRNSGRHLAPDGDAVACSDGVATEGDVLAWLTTIANVAEIDLNKAIRDKYGDGCPGCDQYVCQCS